MRSWIAPKVRPRQNARPPHVADPSPGSTARAGYRSRAHFRGRFIQRVHRLRGRVPPHEDFEGDIGAGRGLRFSVHTFLEATPGWLPARL